jgi:hypothetical protein
LCITQGIKKNEKRLRNLLRFTIECEMTDVLNPEKIIISQISIEGSSASGTSHPFWSCFST